MKLKIEVSFTEDPGNSWWCLAIKVGFQPDPVTGIDPCEYLLRLDEVEVL